MLVLVGVSPELWHAGSGSSAVQRRGVHEHHGSGCYLIVLNVQKFGYEHALSAFEEHTCRSV